MRSRGRHAVRADANADADAGAHAERSGGHSRLRQTEQCRDGARDAQAGGLGRVVRGRRGAAWPSSSCASRPAADAPAVNERGRHNGDLVAERAAVAMRGSWRDAPSGTGRRRTSSSSGRSSRSSRVVAGRVWSLGRFDGQCMEVEHRRRELARFLEGLLNSEGLCQLHRERLQVRAATASVHRPRRQGRCGCVGSTTGSCSRLSS